MKTSLTFLARISARVFLRLRRVVGPLHRRRRSLSEEREAAEERLPSLAAWGDDDRWYGADFPPRQYNALHPMVDGAEYFADLYQALQTARTRVTIAGWCVTPLMPLLRGEGEAQSILADVLVVAHERFDSLG